MDQSTFDEVAKRLEIANKVISKLDPAIRAGAFEVLKPFITGHAEPGDRPGGGGGRGSGTGRGRAGTGSSSTLDVDQLVEDHGGDVPAENALLAAAIFYARHGKEPVTAPQIKRIADEEGLTIPDRPDRTFDGMKRDNKDLFRKVGKTFRLTPHGETWFKNHYKISSGSDPLPE